MNFAFIRRLLRSVSWRRQPSSAHLRLGARGERAAARYLRRCGYRVLVRNYRCPVGEIDLVAAKGETIAFVEVKTRSEGQEDSEPSVGVVRTQQDRVGRSAQHFLNRTEARDRPCRFDIVTVVWPVRGRPRIEHFEDAFHPRGL